VPPIIYEWQDGGAGETNWAETGTHWVTVTDDLGCSSTDTFDVYLNNYPIADFTVDDVCLNNPITPNDLSVNFAEAGIPPLDLTNWNWDFGDNLGTSTDSVPSYQFSEPGEYTVTLILENENGCMDTVQGNVMVNPLPELTASVNAVCIGQTSQFNNSSQIISGQIVSWSWDFDDLGATASDQEPAYTYSETGTYEVSLTATSDLGCESDTLIQAIVAEEAIADFTYTTEPDCGKENLRVFLTNESQYANAYLWDFGTATDTVTNPIYDTPDGNGPLITLVSYGVPGEAVCSDTVVIDITEMWLGIDFDTIPAGNVITPNGDGINDCLSPFYQESYAECYRLQIWDRWGMHLYDSEDEGPEGYCWYGTNRQGNRVSNGTFFFVAEVNSYARSGFVVVTE
ncbi:MAG: PKD domain-containing protein, partial [Flavobacteriales bacterium]|nr:PKD domain-containing protein [Flavobacteriales bacterium]